MDLPHGHDRVGSQEDFDVVNNKSRSPTRCQKVPADLIEAIPIGWRRVAAVDQKVSPRIDSGRHRHSRGW